MVRRLALLVAISSPAAAGDWPQWYGPDRDGLAPADTSLEGWTAAGPQELWRVPIGPGFSSLSIVGDSLYTMATEGDLEILLALDATTGAERWRTPVGKRYQDGMGGDGPRSTPTVVGGRVVALGGHGELIAVDRATGAITWSRDLVAEMGGKVPQWGYCQSPLVDDGRVYLDVGGKGGNGLAAFSLADGSTLWSGTDHGAGYSSPIRMDVGSLQQVIFFTADGPVATAPDTGEVLWAHRWKTSYDVNAATPLVMGDGRLFIASGYGTGAAMLRITTNDGKPKVVEEWTTKRMKNKMSTSVVQGGRLYGFDESRLACLDPATGEQCWSHSGYGRGSLIAAGGQLVVLGEQCDLALATPNGDAYAEVRSPTRIFKDGPCWTVPALAGGVLFARNPHEIVAFQLGGPETPTAAAPAPETPAAAAPEALPAPEAAEPAPAR